MMIRESAAHALPEPDFEQRSGEFVTTVWRDRLTASVLGRLNLNERQLKALPLIRQRSRFSNSDYQTISGATRATAKRDLEDLVSKNVIVRQGRGRGSHYEFKKNGP